jgi:hypothetical protein
MKKNTKIYCVHYNAYAGKWIYQGFRSAWDKLGYEVVPPDPKVAAQYEGTTDTSVYQPAPVSKEELEKDFYIMTMAAMINNEEALEAVKHSLKSFLFVQPGMFPEPWGHHPNFVCNHQQHWVERLSELDNVIFWTFANIDEEIKECYSKWKKEVHTFPLAFDDVNYKPEKVDKYNQIDISFVGGWANNGFNEKRKIMLELFEEFKTSGLKCGFFVNRNLTHQQECNLLANSKMTLNVHDAYQRVLGLDTNERTFKSLGLNGLMVSDTVGQLNELFPELKTSLDPKEIVEITKEILALPQDEKDELRAKNKKMVLDNHCYTSRIQEMLEI